jgi:hypothetical protein
MTRLQQEVFNMTSITFNQLTDFLNRKLSIPENVDDLSITEAALAYARCGWYVLPIKAGTKHPGSLLGTAWPEQSTRDPEEIRRIFKFPDTDIALHVGKSGAIAFDVDEPLNLCLLLQQELFNSKVPFQSTRIRGNNYRGHYLFSLPLGISFGNSVGTLGADWGDVRGQNGVIVVSPSRHAHPDGYYKWKRTGTLPMLPTSLAICLPQRSGDSSSTLTFEEGREFISKNNGNSKPALLQSRLAGLKENPPSINGRHSAMLRFLCLVLKESAVGFYPAADALNQTQTIFNSIKHPSEQTPREFEGMAFWAMAQVEAMTSEEKAFYAENMKWA